MMAGHVVGEVKSNMEDCNDSETACEVLVNVIIKNNEREHLKGNEVTV
jgi:hypothetical protein